MGEQRPSTGHNPLPNRPLALLPSVVAHADWSIKAEKRWMTSAIRADDRYTVGAPKLVGDTGTLLRRLRSLGDGDPAIVGFDFPIGVPANYARRAGVDDFLVWLARLGAGEWERFFDVAERSQEIGTRRPFYPFRPGGTSRRHLLDALGVESTGDLRRQCEHAHTDRRAASPLFWTLGPNQVGKAAIIGWREVLGPGLRDQELAVAIWPFSGNLRDVLKQGRLVVVETYPAEFYHHLGVVWAAGRKGEKSGKGSQVARMAQVSSLLKWADQSGIALDPALQDTIRDGFGPNASGEDQFDATIGLFGMLNVLLGYRPLYEPESDEVRRIEGWIFGQRAIERTASG